MRPGADNRAVARERNGHVEATAVPLPVVAPREPPTRALVRYVRPAFGVQIDDFTPSPEDKITER